MVLRSRLQQDDQSPGDSDNQNDDSQRAHVMMTMDQLSSAVKLEVAPHPAGNFRIGRRRCHLCLDARQSSSEGRNEGKL